MHLVLTKFLMSLVSSFSEVEKIKIHFKSHEAVKQLAHSMPPEKVKVFKSLKDWENRNILIHLKPIEKSWKPQYFFPDSSFKSFIDERLIS